MKRLERNMKNKRKTNQNKTASAS